MRNYLFALLLLIQLLPIGNSSAQSDIKIGVLVSLSGNWEELGNNIRQGITLALEDYKAEGGRHNIILDYQDTSVPFKDRFMKKFSNLPGVFADTAYDGALALFKALDKEDEPKPEETIKTLRSVKINGSSGKEAYFNENGLMVRDISLCAVRLGKIEC